MTPYFSDEWLTIYQGDARDVLPSLPADSVDCIVTSPPYWGLRDYGNDGQLGLEATPEQYVANLVAVFRELRRVLKPSGTCFLNLGDSFLPGKQMAGVPWRVAFALQADGWYLRSDIIWAKPNPMPESVTDRPTKAHEYLFLLTKSARYFYDADAVRETSSVTSHGGTPTGSGKPAPFRNDGDSTTLGLVGNRNLRSVWTIATRPYPGAHFAVFPPELPERCIKAGSSEKGACPECGAPWERIIERVGGPPPGDHRKREGFGGTMKQAHATGTVDGSALSNIYREHGYAENRTIGWGSRSCNHDTEFPEPAVVLDPFAGSGTVGLVANRLSRRAILIDLNPEYVTQQMNRNAQTPLGLGA